MTISKLELFKLESNIKTNIRVLDQDIKFLDEFLFDLDVKTESHNFNIARIVTKSKQITSPYEEIRTSGNLEVSH